MCRNSLFHCVRLVAICGAAVVHWSTPPAARAVSQIDQSHPITGLALGQSITSSRHFAQSFTAGRSGLLSAVDLRLNKLGSASGDLLVAVRKTDSMGVPGVGSNDVLYEATVPVSAITGSGAFTVSVDLSPGGVLVNQGDILAIALRRTTSVEEVTWPAGNPPYAGGAYFVRTGLSQPWSPGSSADAGFQTWVDSAILSTTRTISPAFDATAQIENGVLTLTSTDFSVGVDRSAFFNNERRGILEFPLHSLPQNAIIRAATLEIRVSSLLQSDTISPRVSFHGYAGNGSLSVSDASVPLNPIGDSGMIEDLGPLSVALDAAYIQSILGQTDYLGLLALAEIEDYGMQFWASEILTPSYRPRLVLDYEIPTANSGDYNGNGIVDAADYTLWRNTLGQSTAAGTNADGNGNGQIDLPDYTYWKSRFGLTVGGAGAAASGPGGGSALASVPEPASFALLLVGMLLAAGCSRDFR